jgi:hypothetical protein
MVEMPKETKRRDRIMTVNCGPIKPDSPLHRALEMIAREIAKDLETEALSKGRTERQREAPNKPGKRIDM